LRSDGTKIWREEILDKSFRNTDAEMGHRRTVECKNKEKLHKMGINMIKYKEKWKGTVRKNERDVDKMVSI
jgi:hypothetical protein